MINETTKAKEVARKLLEIEAVSLSPQEPFTWTSGLRTPIYCDNRLIISYPNVRTFIENEFVALIERNYPDVEVIAGTATAGIPHAAIIADKMNLPLIYVRSSKKGHGKHNAIEGRVEPGQKVVMVEDLISTGGSVIDAAEKVTEAGAEVLGCVAIFNYLLPKGVEAFEKQPYDLHTLTNYPTLIEVATENEELLPFKETLNDWYQDPVKWSSAHSE